MGYVKYPILGCCVREGRVVVCGGGGSAKTGIHNSIAVFSIDGDEERKQAETSTQDQLATSLAFSEHGLLLAVSVGACCWVYEVAENQLKLLVQFRTDFAPQDSEQSCVVFVGNSMLLTGGQDGVIRIWQLKWLPKNEQHKTDLSLDAVVAPSGAPVQLPQVGDSAFSTLSDEERTLQVELVHEYCGHSKRIKTIQLEPFSQNLVISSEENQIAHLWRVHDRLMFSNYHLHSLPRALNASAKDSDVVPNQKTCQFRCFAFSDNGKWLFSVLSPSRGQAFVLQWQYKNNKYQLLNQIPACTSVPVSALAVFSKFVALGCADGSILMYGIHSVNDITTLLPISHLLPHLKHHDFAITSLHFQFLNKNNKESLSLISAGADSLLQKHFIPLDLELKPKKPFYYPVVTFCRKVIKCSLLFNVSIISMGLLVALSFLIQFTWLSTDPLLVQSEMLKLSTDFHQLQTVSQPTVVCLGSLLLCLSLSFCGFLLLLNKTNSIRKASAVGFLQISLLSFVAMGILLFISVSATNTLQPSSQSIWQKNLREDPLLGYKGAVVFGAVSLISALFHALFNLLANN